MDETLKGITPTSIINGVGLNVCLLLNHFADCCLKSTRFEVKLPIHITEPEDEAVEEPVRLFMM